MASADGAGGVAASGKNKGGASSRQPASAEIGRVLPTGTLLEARDIDSAVIGDAIARAAAVVVGKGQDWRGRSAFVNDDGLELSRLTDVAGLIDLASTNSASLVVAFRDNKGRLCAGTPGLAAVGGVLPAGAIL